MADHVCGLMGFNGMIDECPGCYNREKQYIWDQIQQIRLRHDQELKPYFDKLIEIERMNPSPRPIFITDISQLSKITIDQIKRSDEDIRRLLDE